MSAAALPMPPERQMRLARLGAFFPTRLSFARRALRQIAGAACRRAVWNMNDAGHGHAVYTVQLPDGHPVSLAAFSNALDDSQRSDRVIAEAWDSAFVLFDGIPDAADLARLQANAPRQESGRFTERDLVLSRANKSVRFFEHSAARLAQGQQPCPQQLAKVGYLMRTTAVYGNGKFGIADRAALIRRRPFFAPPFQAEMLAVWLIRLFSLDLVQHIARARAPDCAAPLGAANQRLLGIGNATGLGMAPFLVNHPRLLHNWIAARNAALQQVLRLPPSPAQTARIATLLARARRHVAHWRTDDALQAQRIETLAGDLQQLNDWADGNGQAPAATALRAQAQQYSLECQELIDALLLETLPNPDDYADAMRDDYAFAAPPAMTAGDLRALIAKNYGWALRVNYAAPQHSRRYWHVSAEKLEPRFGERPPNSPPEHELPLDIGRQTAALARALQDAPAAQPLAVFLRDKPHLRGAARRVQLQAAHPYAEIQDNLIGDDCRPIDLLRCKLSFLGACGFDPKSDLWTRITLFQGAPLPQHLQDADADDWWLPAP